VDWSGSGWVLSGQQYTNDIAGYYVCTEEDCGTQQSPHGYGYKLLAQVNGYRLGCPLAQVRFTPSVLLP